MGKKKTNHQREIDKHNLEATPLLGNKEKETSRNAGHGGKEKFIQMKEKKVSKNRLERQDLSYSRRSKRKDRKFKEKCELLRHYHQLEEAEVEQYNVLSEELSVLELWEDEPETEDLFPRQIDRLDEDPQDLDGQASSIVRNTTMQEQFVLGEESSQVQ